LERVITSSCHSCRKQ